MGLTIVRMLKRSDEDDNHNTYLSNPEKKRKIHNGIDLDLGKENETD